jgi:5-methylcytosine-specific restriction enzyme A
MNQENFAYHVGLTPDQFWKRGQAARVLKKYPEFGDMIDAGETGVSHVARLSSQITPANAKMIARGIKHKSSREVRDFLAMVTPDGRTRETTETFVDIKLRLSKSQMDVLERAREILSHGGHIPTTGDLVMLAIEELVDRRDPVKKSEWAAARAMKKTQIDGQEYGDATAARQADYTAARQSGASDLDSDGQTAPVELSALKQDAPGRPKLARIRIPAAIRHKVWQRDGGYCTNVLSPGYPCQSRMMLEVDHIVPVARGGQNQLQNLTLKCRRHNQWTATQMFGQDHMDQYRH